jgi:hypothetical protein
LRPLEGRGRPFVTRLTKAQRQVRAQLRALNAARRAAVQRSEYLAALPTWARLQVLEQVRARDAARRAKSAAAPTTPPPLAAASGGDVGGSGDESHFRNDVGGSGNESDLPLHRERAPSDLGYNPLDIKLDSLGGSIGRSSATRGAAEARDDRQLCDEPGDHGAGDGWLAAPVERASAARAPDGGGRGGERLHGLRTARTRRQTRRTSSSYSRRRARTTATSPRWSSRSRAAYAPRCCTARTRRRPSSRSSPR